MKVLMLHPHDIFGDYEPWTTRIVNIVDYICRKGHEVKLLYFVFKGREKEFYNLKRNLQVKGLSRKINLFNFFNNIVKITKLVEWADVVHFQKCFHYVSIPALIACTIRNKPIHYDWDDWETKIFYNEQVPFWNKPVGFFIYTLEKFIPKLVDTISVSSCKLKELCKDYGVPEERIYKVRVGADLSMFSPRKERDLIKEKYNIPGRLVLYLGQLHGAQYVSLFLHSIEIILKRYKIRGVKFMIVGGGKQLKKLQQLAKEIGIDKNIVFTGHIKHENIPKYINTADICVGCFKDNDITRAKSPLKIVEYLASGKAIVASEVGEVKKMVEGAGLLVNPGDPESLADGIIRILKNDKLKEGMEKRARKRAENVYNWSNTAGNLLECYHNILNKSNVGNIER